MKTLNLKKDIKEFACHVKDYREDEEFINELFEFVNHKPGCSIEFCNCGLHAFLSNIYKRVGYNDADRIIREDAVLQSISL